MIDVNKVERVGRSWELDETFNSATQQQSHHELIELVPIKPKGWMIFINGIMSFAGIIFSYHNAMMQIDARKQLALRKKTIWGAEAIKWRELSRCPMERLPPEGACVSIIKNLPEEDALGNEIYVKRSSGKVIETTSVEFTPAERPRTVIPPARQLPIVAATKPTMVLLPAAPAPEVLDAKEKPISVLK